ncbi:MAG: hypothetical protein PHF31_12240 [Methylobacter sp.]|nr:hypothetical protein [Methylobacter sp.]
MDTLKQNGRQSNRLANSSEWSYLDVRHTPPDQDQLTLPNAQQFKHTVWLRDEVSYEFDSEKGIDQI